MAGPFFRVELRLLPPEKCARRHPIYNDYRPNWDLGNTWLGEPTINDGRVWLEHGEQLALGEEGVARIEPTAPEFWGGVRVGAIIAMQEGARVVGYARVLEIVSRPEHWTPEVAAFVDQARQFCDFIQKAGGYPLETRLAAARQRILALYDKGRFLPDVDPPEGIEEGPNPPRPDGWQHFGEYEYYWEVLDPYEVDREPGCGSLSDDLLDIYFDLQPGLELWDHDDLSKLEAIWCWRWGFHNHWGDHAVNALRALHRACRVA